MPTRRFEKIVEGVYYVTSTGSISAGSNAVVIVNEDDAMLIDPGESPAAARMFLEDIKTITNKPVKWSSIRTTTSTTRTAIRSSGPTSC
jgi:hypothetical protein